MRQAAGIRQYQNGALIFVQHGKQPVEVRDLFALLCHQSAPWLLCIFRENLAVAITAPPRLQKLRPGDAHQPAGETAVAAKPVQLLPCMDETVLRKIIGERIVTAQAAQELAYLRLVAAHQFTESRRLLANPGARNQLTVCGPGLVVVLRCQGQSLSSLSLYSTR